MHDLDIHFGSFRTALGLMLVAATSRGICFVAFGDEAETMERELRRAFPVVTVTRDASRVSGWIADIERRIAGAAAATDVPLDATGTPFQELVWAALRRMPRGERCSYRDLAERIGRPTAARAVARACASNRVAVLIPCHRVVRGTGALGGYRWGMERKQALLEAERVV